MIQKLILLSFFILVPIDTRLVNVRLAGIIVKENVNIF